MAETVNQQIADRLVRRHIQAARVESALRQQVLERLAMLEQDILAAIKTADPTQYALLSRRRREVENLMQDALDPLIQARYARLAALLDTALLRLAQSEAEAVQTILAEETDEDKAGIVVPSDRQLRAGVTQTLFPSPATPTTASATGADWWGRAAESLTQRLHDTLLVSVSLEESLTQMTQRVRGTADMGFQDGVMARARQDATRLLTTQSTNALSEARMAVGDRNPQRLIAVHTSTLDSRTSYICLARNGLRYTLPDHEPINHDVPYLNGPPYHPHCRSIMTIIVDNGGPVAQETTAQWLRRQGAAVQDEVLGPTRAQLFRDGRLSNPRDLLDAATGRPLTLEELGV